MIILLYSCCWKNLKWLEVSFTIIKNFANVNTMVAWLKINPMDDTDRVKKMIQKEFTDFEISSIVKSGEGMDNEAYVINDTHIFRFPKRRNIYINLQREVDILPELSSLANLRVPDFTYVSKKMFFVGYKKIPGIFLTKKLYSSFTVKTKTGIQKSIGEFLTILHDPHLANFVTGKLRIINFKEEYEEDFKNTQTIIYPHLSLKVQHLITKQFNSYLNEKKNFSYTPVLLHNDLSADHILIDKVKHTINGIIDFGDIAMGDPDYDLMYLFRDIGLAFTKDLLQFYKHDDFESLFKKLNFFVLSNILQCLIRAFQEKDKDDCKQGIISLNKWLVAYKPAR